MNTHIKLPPLRRPQVPRIDADIDLADIRRLINWCEKTAKSYGHAAIEAATTQLRQQLADTQAKLDEALAQQEAIGAGGVDRKLHTPALQSQDAGPVTIPQTVISGGDCFEPATITRKHRTTNEAYSAMLATAPQVLWTEAMRQAFHRTAEIRHCPSMAKAVVDNPREVFLAVMAAAQPGDAQHE